MEGLWQVTARGPYRPVAILIVLEQGWKYVLSGVFEGIITGRNPHCTGAGLEGKKESEHECYRVCRNPHCTGAGLEAF